ncbi:MAG: hypothetical protein OHK0039_44870 [Bacteroidia bacterium]
MVINDADLIIHQPHDHFFKYLFGQANRVASFLRGALPSHMLERLDLATLRSDPTSYIDAQLRTSFADAVFRCDYAGGGELFVAFLLEYKSYPASFPHLQLLRYLLHIWEQHSSQTTLPLILPYVFYHGSRPWNYESMETYFGPDAGIFRQAIPAFDYLFFNLHDEREEASGSSSRTAFCSTVCCS